jgi:predicted GIY-YIG superfamily endonuclease
MDKELYIGSTSDLRRRLSEHNSGKSKQQHHGDLSNLPTMKITMQRVMLYGANTLSNFEDKRDII